jgi:hypothetical protein
MPEFTADRVLPLVPDNLTLDETHEMRPTRSDAAPWLVSSPQVGIQVLSHTIKSTSRPTRIGPCEAHPRG